MSCFSPTLRHRRGVAAAARGRALVAAASAVVALLAMDAGAAAARPLASAPDSPIDTRWQWEFGPYDVSNITDVGSCGNVWAVGHSVFYYSVGGSAGPGGSRWLRGWTPQMWLTTVETRSPGACDPRNADLDYAKVVDAGIPVRGQQLFTVPIHGSFDPTATCPDPCDPVAFARAFFGPDWRPDGARLHLWTRYVAPRASRYQRWSTHTGPRGNTGDICCHRR